MEIIESTAAAKFFKTRTLLGAQTELALQLLALGGNLTRLLLCLKHIECVACSRSPV